MIKFIKNSSTHEKLFYGLSRVKQNFSRLEVPVLTMRFEFKQKKKDICILSASCFAQSLIKTEIKLRRRISNKIIDLFLKLNFHSVHLFKTSENYGSVSKFFLNRSNSSFMPGLPIEDDEN